MPQFQGYKPAADISGLANSGDRTFGAKGAGLEQGITMCQVRGKTVNLQRQVGVNVLK